MGEEYGIARGFTDQAELVNAELEIARARIRFALAARESQAKGERFSSEWPDEFAAAETHVRERVAATSAEGPELPLNWLRTRLGLGDRELRVLWVLLAHELCAVSRAMLRQINTEACADPTTDTIRLVAFGGAVYAEASRLLAANSPLVLGALIERTDTDHNAPDHRKTWKIARRIVALAHGDLSMDPDLFRIATIVPVSGDPIGIAGEGVETDPESSATLLASLHDWRHDGRTIIVQGQRGTGRRSLLRQTARAHGIELIEVDTARISRSLAAARAQLAAIARECRLFARVPLFRDLDSLVVSIQQTDSIAATINTDLLDQLVLDLRDLLVLATTSSVIPGNRLHKPQIIEPLPLTGVQRSRLWSRALPTVSLDDLELLADMYPVAPALIDAAAGVAQAQLHPGNRKLDPKHVRLGLRAVLDGQLVGLASRINITQSWDALVLPDEQRQSIEELIARVKQRRTVYETWGLAERFGRGLGVSALFGGPPGTGKTMAAGLIARELATDVYQVDMSKISSKWIGETEKNLSALFDAAEAGQVMLLFDEADALFGKRTEVKTSNDRHANQETNFLLQRLESFRGICILTTNNVSAIDEAFKRRISFHVQFPMPEFAERVTLWRSMLQHPLPTSGQLDYNGLAERYEMSGGYIRNAVLRGAFFAANAGTSVTNKHLFHAALLEDQAMGRIVISAM